jgi:enterochelin esterase-like enzyme
MKYLRFRPLLLLAALTIFLLGCDPLAPEPTPIVIVLTATPTPVPTAVPSATPTITPTPTPEPTATPTFSLPTPWVCNETKGRVLDLTFESKVARQTMPYRIYLPPCYTQTGKRYPYVILMHGSDRDEKEWTDLLKAHEAMDAGLALGALPPMILVMPGHGKALPSTGNTLANMNSFVKGQSWESLILDELMPAIERSFCTWNDREGRAIGGISRGGFWAFSIAFRNPSLFSAIGGHSPFFDPTMRHRPITRSTWRRRCSSHPARSRESGWTWARTTTPAPTWKSSRRRWSGAASTPATR